MVDFSISVEGLKAGGKKTVMPGTKEKHPHQEQTQMQAERGTSSQGCY